MQSFLPELLSNSLIFKLLLASFLGAIIGFERNIHGRAAGLRTNLLVSLGATVFMILSEDIALFYGEQLDASLLRADPSRIAAQIITGIGFLGAGAIIKYGLSIRGLTTAACLWISAAIGMSVGAGYFDMAILTTLISLFALIFLSRLEKFYPQHSYRELEVSTSNKTKSSALVDLIKRKNLKILNLDKERNYNKKIMDLIFTIRLTHKNKNGTDEISRKIIDDLEKSGIELFKVKWRRQ